MNNYKAPRHRSNSGRVWIGLIIIIIGFSMLTQTLGYMFHVPDWLFSWPMWLIIFGLIRGSRDNFRSPGSAIIIIIGCFFLSEKVFDLSLDRFFWPAFIIALGCWLVAGKNSKWRKNTGPSGTGPVGDPPPTPPDPGVFPPADQQDVDWDRRVDPEATGQTEENQVGSAYQAEPNPFSESYQTSSEKLTEDYIDSVSIFGGVKKNIYSKNFMGGDIVNIMGGADINLLQADIRQPIVLEVVQIFGGTTIIVPAHWKVNPEMTAIFGGVEDKRFINNIAVDNQKTLIIKGTSVFGGITIKSI